MEREGAGDERKRGREEGGGETEQKLLRGVAARERERERKRGERGGEGWGWGWWGWGGGREIEKIC